MKILALDVDEIEEGQFIVFDVTRFWESMNWKTRKLYKSLRFTWGVVHIMGFDTEQEARYFYAQYVERKFNGTVSKYRLD